MPSAMQNLTLNDLHSDMSLSSKGGVANRRNKHNMVGSRIKKRRFKEIDNAWDLNVDAGSQSVIAVQPREDMSDETLSLNSRKGNNRRCIKLN